MMDCSSSSSSSVGSYLWLSALYQFPSKYKLVSVLGRGGFGDVLKCIKEDTNETVAVKVPQHNCSLNNELALLNFFMWNNLDKKNIVKFIDSFTMRDNRTALAFEMLDVTLKDYILYMRDFTPLDLHEVRSVVQQMATALNALKTINVIHSDIKLDNIMLVDSDAQPLRVKLIDFGLAFPTCRVKQGATHQTTHYRAPEIILGLPFSEAIDMWSLGVVMAFMVLGDALFPGNSEYDAMRCIVDLLGVPPDHLLNAGRYSNRYFEKTSSGHWRLKTPQEYWRNYTPPGDYRAYQFRNLDDVETLPQKNLNMVEADEKKECIDLLKAMLQMDGNERITPSQVLAHPFITRGSLHHSSDNETLESSTSHTTEPGTSETAESGTIQATEPGTSQAADPGTSQAAEPGTSQAADPGTSQAAEPGTIQTKENKADDCTSETLGTASTLPPGVIFVRPPRTACGLSWEEERELMYETCSTSETFGSSPLLPGVILAQHPQTDCSLSNSSSGFYGSTSATFHPGVILVRPAPAECCLPWHEDSGQQSENCRLDWFEGLSENSPVVYSGGDKSDASAPPLPEDHNMEQEHTELTATASGGKCSPPLVSELPDKKKKKKKNGLKRFFLWMKMTFCSCISVEDDEG